MDPDRPVFARRWDKRSSRCSSEARKHSTQDAQSVRKVKDAATSRRSAAKKESRMLTLESKSACNRIRVHACTLKKLVKTVVIMQLLPSSWKRQMN